ncbi:endonuclease domain-containing protein [Demequina sp. SO4-13]|uniref:endonuclease domain-containing protein n=1 Tax=Demequina sp. SO4-13 TaxID=3401027 RepID=UPI003AF57B72
MITALNVLGGAARRHQLRGLGVTDEQIRAAVRSEAVLRPHRGCYALAGADSLVIRARVMSARLTCASAARLLGLPLIQAVDGVHLAIPHDRGLVVDDARRRDREVHHRTRSPSDQAPLCRAVDIVDHLGKCANALTQLGALDAALAMGAMTEDEIDRFSTTPCVRREWLRAHCDVRTGSPAETAARVELTRSGFDLTSQVQIDGVGRVDFVVNGTLVVEIDGETYHSDRQAFAEDRRRDRALATLGMPILRFTAHEALAHDGRIARAVGEFWHRRAS